MLRPIRLVLLVLVAAVSMQGCLLGLGVYTLVEATSQDDYYEPYYDDYYGDPVDVYEASLGGDFGSQSAPVRDADAYAYSEGNWTYVELMNERNGEAKMAIVEVWGDLEEIPTGESRVYRSADDGEDGYVSVTGCAGPARYSWERDEMADVVEVRVRQSETNPEMRTYTFNADFRPNEYTGTVFGSDSSASTLTGAFDAP